MTPDLALAVIKESIAFARSVWDAMDEPQKRYWIQKGIDNDKAFVAFVEKTVQSFLKALGNEAQK